jgi:hypothetical protein
MKNTIINIESQHHSIIKVCQDFTKHFADSLYNDLMQLYEHGEKSALINVCNYDGVVLNTYVINDLQNYVSVSQTIDTMSRRKTIKLVVTLEQK